MFETQSMGSPNSITYDRWYSYVKCAKQQSAVFKRLRGPVVALPGARILHVVGTAISSKSSIWPVALRSISPWLMRDHCASSIYTRIGPRSSHYSQ